MPYLWWGIGIDSGAGVGSTVVASLSNLLPHLVSARVAARRRQSGRDVASELTQLALDLSLPIAEGAIDFAGLGAIKSIGQAAFKIGGALKRGTASGSRIVDEARAPIESLVDTVMADLAALFTSGTRRFAGMPLVVLVDDAQFADDDTAVAALVERLIARASREGWPLLLILTHRARQMGHWEDGTGRWRLPSRVSRVLQHAREGRPEELGHAANEGGGTLPEEAFVHIDLSEPVDDLTAALRNQFPGLTGDDTSAIAVRAGGNPRKLEQIVEKMKRKPDWFEGSKTDGPLTETGRATVLTLADLPILDVVVDRLADTPPEVRRALMMAGLMGSRFVCDLVDRLALAQLQGSIRPGIEAGELNYRFLRDVVDRSRNDVGGFNEQLFREAAEEYRVSGKALQDLSDWPTDQALNAALDGLLEVLVLEPGRFDGLAADDLSEAFSLASTRMITAQHNLAGLALARLVEVENARGNPEGAYGAAQQFIVGFET